MSVVEGVGMLRYTSCIWMIRHVLCCFLIQNCTPTGLRSGYRRLQYDRNEEVAKGTSKLGKSKLGSCRRQEATRVYRPDRPGLPILKKQDVHNGHREQPTLA